MRKYEVFEDGGGGIHLVILEDNNPVYIYSGFEYTNEPGVILDALNDLKQDPDAHFQWDGNLMESMKDWGDTRSIDEVYDEMWDYDDLIAWVDAFGDFHCIPVEKMGFAGSTVLNLERE